MRKFFAYELLSYFKKVDRRYTLRFIACLCLSLIMIVGLTSCMSRPWQNIKLTNKYDPNCIFFGVLLTPDTDVIIEAWVPPNGDVDGYWTEIVTAKTQSRGWHSFYWIDIDVYSFETEGVIPEYLWRLYEDRDLYFVNLRARIKETDQTLISMNKDGIWCLEASITNGDTLVEFLNECQAEDSPKVRVLADWDYHQECVDAINKLRVEEEGLQPLDRKIEKEDVSDLDARRNYYNGAHSSIGGVWGGVNVCGQNDCDSYQEGTKRQEVLECIVKGMYWKERACYEELGQANCYKNPDCKCGHYMQMTDRIPDSITGKPLIYKSVSCGIYEIVNPMTGVRSYYSVQNFWDWN